MMQDRLENPWRGTGLGLDAPWPIAEATDVIALLGHCPAHAQTPLKDAPALALRFGVARVSLKDERSRMGLGSFKALGAAYAIAREAAATGQDWATALQGRTYVTASAGNHGLSVAAGARLFGAQAVIYLAQTVPEAFEQRLAGQRRAGRSGRRRLRGQHASRRRRRRGARGDAAVRQFVAGFIPRCPCA